MRNTEIKQLAAKGIRFHGVTECYTITELLLEFKVSNHDVDIQAIFEAIRQLMAPPPEPPKRRIGFHAD